MLCKKAPIGERYQGGMGRSGLSHSVRLPGSCQARSRYDMGAAGPLTRIKCASPRPNNPAIRSLAEIILTLGDLGFVSLGPIHWWGPFLSGIDLRKPAKHGFDYL